MKYSVSVVVPSFLFLFVLSFSVIGEVLFQDDFTNCGESNRNWVAVDETQTTAQCANGVYSVQNTSANFTSLIFHNLTGTKPSTFTLSCTVTRPNASADGVGIYYCLTASGRVTGYTLQIGASSWIYAVKYNSDGNTTLLNVQSSSVRPLSNEIKISKQGSTFNVFCNGAFVGSFTDPEFASGDIGLLVPPNASATFDNISMTDQFEQGSYRTCFADDFEDGVLSGWSQFGGNVTVEEKSGVLDVQTPAGQDAHVYTDVALENFVGRVITSHRRGNKESMYGFLIIGESDTIIPMAGFVVTGNRKYATFVSGQQFSFSPSTAINGAAYVDVGTGDTTFYHDTLEIFKRQGSSEYVFAVNSDTVGRLGNVPFSIVGAGVLCEGDVNVHFDDFIIAEGQDFICKNQPTFARFPLRRHYHNVLTGGIVFDPLGRVIRNGNAKLEKTGQSLVPGLYLIRNQKDRSIRHLQISR